MFVFFVLVLSVSATNYKVGTVTVFYATCILPNGSLGGDNVSLTVIYPNSTTWLGAVDMGLVSTGVFSYNVTIPSVLGTYNLVATCYYVAGSNSSTASEQFQVVSVEASDFVSISVDASVDNSLVIVEPIVQVFDLDDSFFLKFRVFNSSKFLLSNSSVSCSMDLFSFTGGYLFSGSLDSSGSDFIFNSSSVTLSSEGVYNYNVRCNGSEAGVLSSKFELVTGVLDYNKFSGSNGWMVIVLAIGFMAFLFAFLSFNIKVKSLYNVKILFFALSVVLTFILGFIAYMITLNPGRVDLFSPVTLTLFSIFGLLFILFIFWYGLHLFNAVLKKGDDDE